jgi:extracellular factor (EF) 3-hydroxypalmitic acid methyl ester biosynthesis protein
MSIARLLTPAEAERTQRLRARRIAIDVQKLGDVGASLRHGEAGALEGTVQDLSLHGLAVAVPQVAQQGLLMSGDRLESVIVRCQGAVLFQGTGILRRISEQPDRRVLGIELEGGALDLARLHLQETRQSFAHRWHQLDVGSRHAAIAPEFKAWVSDVRGYLEVTREFLVGEEKKLASDDQLTREQTTQQYMDELLPRFLQDLFELRDQLNRLVQHLSESEHEVYRAYFRLHVLGLIFESPLLRRSFEKPLGYAGDYEMMNMLYRDHAEGATLFGKALNVYAASEGAARANINRIEFLGEKIRALVASRPQGRVRLASVGCGPAQEIAALLRNHPQLGRHLDVALIDQEERSIVYCERTLAPLALGTGARIQFIRESVRHLLTSKQLAQALGERELIYSAGLFDYLSERSFHALLSVLWDAVAPGGALAVGNVALQNPSRWMMEYWCDWYLNHRSPEDLLRQAGALTPAPIATNVESEPTGYNLFLVLRR